MLVPGRLKKLRKKTKLSQEQFAEKLDIARSTYSGYETGSSEPDLKTLIEIADNLEVSIDYLTGRTDNPMVSKNEQISRVVDLSDDNLINLNLVFDDRPLSFQTKNKAIRILQEFLRLEVQEEDR